MLRLFFGAATAGGYPLPRRRLFGSSGNGLRRHRLSCPMLQHTPAPSCRETLPHYRGPICRSRRSAFFGRALLAAQLPLNKSVGTGRHDIAPGVDQQGVNLAPGQYGVAAVVPEAELPQPHPKRDEGRGRDSTGHAVPFRDGEGRLSTTMFCREIWKNSCYCNSFSPRRRRAVSDLSARPARYASEGALVISTGADARRHRAAS
jgi:hypothetical protein